MRPSAPALAALALATLPASLPLAAHVRQPQAAAAPAKVHKIEKLAENVYCIYGNGGNIGLVVTDKGAVLIDDQFEDIAPGLLEAVKSITDKPIKYLVNTHWHGDHTGANIVLEKQVTAIIAHTNVRSRLEKAQAKEGEKKGGLPEITVGFPDPKERAVMAIHLGGVEMHLLHQAAGHTDGDLVLGLPVAHVMHLGDLFFNGLIPYIDLESGGSLEGMIANADGLLAWIPEDVKLIPGHGPVGGKKDYARFRDFLKAVQAHVKANPKLSGKELDEAFDHKTWSDFKPLGKFLSYDKFFDIAAGRRPK
ncbi:MAG: MBL fold metallo-hydrolase [Holophagaceae bacterium]|nr:MBL fold metallo-hydrolase [Holophagaceae bacterium]